MPERRIYDAKGNVVGTEPEVKTRKIYSPEGNIIGTIPIEEKLLGGELSGIRATTESDEARGIIDKLIRPGLTIAGAGIVGGITKSPFTARLAGELAGGFVGSELGQMLEQITNRPETAVNPVPIMGNALIESGINAAITPAMRMASKLAVKPTSPFANRVEQGFYSKMFPTYNAPEDVAALMEYAPELKPTVGQATGSPLAKFLEGAFNRRELLTRSREQGQKVLDRITRFRRELGGATTSLEPIPQDYFGQTAGEIIERNRELLKGKEKLAYSTADSIADQNAMELDVITKYNKISIPETSATPGKVIPGLGLGNISREVSVPVVEKVRMTPVFVSNTNDVIAQEGIKLDEMFSDSYINKLPDWVANRYKQVKQAFDSFTKPVKAIIDGQEVELKARGFDKVRELRTQIGKTIFQKSEANWTNQERILGKMYKSLTQDLEFSIPTWKNGKTALEALDKAHKLTVEKYSVFNDMVMGTVRRNRTTPAYPTTMLEPAYKSKDIAREIKSAMANLDPEDTTILKSGYFENLISKGYNKAEQKLYQDKILDELLDVDSPAQVIFNQGERNRLVTFFRALRPLGAKDTQSGIVALRIREAGLVMTLGGGLTGLLARGYVTSGLSAGVTGIGIITGARAMSQALLKPETAFYATKLLRLAPGTPEANFASRMVLRALKGTQVMVDVPRVGIFPATIQDDGKIKPLDLGLKKVP